MMESTKNCVACTVDEIVDHILMLGQGTPLGKMDVKQAYRQVPVRPQDRLLLGMKWEETIYIDKVLPLGLPSAPLLFKSPWFGTTLMTL